MADTNNFGLTFPAEGVFAITPHVTDPLAQTTRAIMVTVGGDVAVTMFDGSTGTIPGLEPGQVYPFRCTHVKVSGTTATGIIGLI